MKPTVLHAASRQCCNAFSQSSSQTHLHKAAKAENLLPSRDVQSARLERQAKLRHMPSKTQKSNAQSAAALHMHVGAWRSTASSSRGTTGQNNRRHACMSQSIMMAGGSSCRRVYRPEDSFPLPRAHTSCGRPARLWRLGTLHPSKFDINMAEPNTAARRHAITPTALTCARHMTGLGSHAACQDHTAMSAKSKKERGGQHAGSPMHNHLSLITRPSLHSSASECQHTHRHRHTWVTLSHLQQCSLCLTCMRTKLGCWRASAGP